MMRIKTSPEKSATLRRPVIESGPLGNVVVGWVLRATGEPCDEENNPIPKMTPVIESVAETRKAKRPE